MASRTHGEDSFEVCNWIVRECHQLAKKQHKRYGTINNCCRQIKYDVRHGVTNEEVLSFLQKIRFDSSYSSTQNDAASIGRLIELEKQFIPANRKGFSY